MVSLFKCVNKFEIKNNFIKKVCEFFLSLFVSQRKFDYHLQLRTVSDCFSIIYERFVFDNGNIVLDTLIYEKRKQTTNCTCLSFYLFTFSKCLTDKLIAHMN